MIDRFLTGIANAHGFLAKLWVLARPRAYRMAGKLGRLLAPVLPNPWTRQRELPPLPAKSFRAQWRKRVRPR